MKRKLHESDYGSDIVMYVNGNSVDLSNGIASAVMKYIKDSDFRNMIIDYVNSFGDPLVDFYVDDFELANVFSQVVEMEREVEDFYVDMHTDRGAGNKYNVEIFEKGQEVESKKASTKKLRIRESALKEGAGAGYTIKVKGINLEHLEDFDLDEFTDDGAIFNVEYTGTADSVQADSYMYGTEVLENVPIMIKKIFIDYEIVETDGRSFEETFRSISTEEFIDCVDAMIQYYGSDIEYVYGGGWIHSKYDGTFGEISQRRDDIFEGVITDKSVVNYIDEAVQGDNTDEYYKILIDNFDIYDTTEVESDAINIAEELGERYKAENDYTAVTVEKVTAFIDFSGNIVDEYEETVWEFEY